MDRSSFEKERFTTSKRPPYPPEFRNRMIDLVRSGRSPEDLAKEFEPSGQTIRNGCSKQIATMVSAMMD